MDIPYIKTKPVFLMWQKQGRDPMAKKFKNLSAAQRMSLRNFGIRCHYCNGRIFEVFDHVVPKKSGGTDDWQNLVPSCRSCNGAKRTMAYDIFKEIMVAEKIALEVSLMGDC